jgi:outer membrane protein assembly factor BamB
MNRHRLSTRISFILFILILAFTSLGKADWVMFGSDPAHTGVGTGGPVITPTVVWKHLTGGPVRSSPSVVNGVVYVGSDDDHVYALNVTTGAHLWNYSTASPVRSSPAVAYGVVYIGCNDGNFYALNANTGAKLWNYTTEGYIDSSPAAVNGIVYIGSYDGNIYAFNALNGSMIWSYSTGIPSFRAAVVSSPAVVNGVVYICADDSNIYAFDAYDGVKLWNYSTGQQVLTSSPAVSDGLVYVGAFDGYVYALNATTGSMVWNHDIGGITSSCPAVANGQVYIGCENDYIYSLNAATGAEIWRQGTGNHVSSSPAVANGAVYIGSFDDKVYGLNATSGSTLWTYQTGGACESSPAVVNGVVYEGSDDGYVYAFSAAPVDHFVFNSVNNQIAGTAFSVTITAVDSQGNSVINFNGSLSLTYSKGSVNPSSLAGGFSDGVWIGYVTVTNAAVGVTLNVNDGNGHAGVSNQFTVTHASVLSNLAISPSDSSVTAGLSKTYSTIAYDNYGNSWVITSSSSWSISASAGGQWIGNTYTSATAGYWTITATYGSIINTTSLTVSPAGTNQFVVDVSQTVTAKSPFTLTVTAKDAYNNTVIGYSTPASLSPSSGSIYPASTGTSGWLNGVWSNLVTLSSPAFSVFISVSDGTHSGTSNTFVVNAVIVASAGIGGSISPSGNVQVNLDANKTFTITAYSNYQIDNVLVDGQPQGSISSYTFPKIVANHVISASFKPAPIPPAPTPTISESSTPPRTTTGSEGPISIPIDTLTIAIVASAVILVVGFQLLHLRVKAKQRTRFVPSIDDPDADRAVARDIDRIQEKLAVFKTKYPELSTIKPSTSANELLDKTRIGSK